MGVFALIAVTVANFWFRVAGRWRNWCCWYTLPLSSLRWWCARASLARLCGLSIWILIRILKDELILAYSTAKQRAMLPRIIRKMEAYGAGLRIAVSWYRWCSI
ncbi:hypothetical protein KCP78_21840 [Salmonella enterica subsp. enterica]|nr:hypothetical protein KCP78_21840 [Salmonella enterica subsp. enterica]